MNQQLTDWPPRLAAGLPPGTSLAVLRVLGLTIEVNGRTRIGQTITGAGVTDRMTERVLGAMLWG